MNFLCIRCGKVFSLKEESAILMLNREEPICPECAEELESES